MTKKRERTPAQLANDARLREMAQKRREEAGQKTAPASIAFAEPTIQDPNDVEVQDKADKESLQRQINQLMEDNALFRAALLRGQLPAQQGQSVGVGRTGNLIGEVDKYLVDPVNYPDPTPRLAQEKRLQTIAFNHNYELQYDFTIRSYETKTGINMREPEFTVTLLKVVLDDQGERVRVIGKDGKPHDKFYIARRLMFHEDPQAALVLARENNIMVDKEDEKTFLDEMRYLRVRDWLFGYLWPRPADSIEGVHEESIGGTIVQVYLKSSEEPSHVDFDQIKTKV